MRRLSREERRLLRLYERAMDRLDEFDRRVFLGHRVDELDYQELADLHGVSIEEVEDAMIRSLRVIARTVDERNRRRWQFWRR